MFIPGYYFILIKKVNRDSLHFNILNLEVLGEYLEKPFGGIKKIKHNDNYLIVDSPEKVRKFIKKCLKHPEILTFERSTFGFDSIILRRL